MTAKQTNDGGGISLLRRLFDDKRGTVLAVSVAALTVLIGSTALAVDLGMFITARTQSQRAADAGALAGAMMLADPSGLESEARQEARHFANRHEVLGHNAQVTDADVDVIMDSSKVRVRVRHRLPTVFARIFGADSVEVATVGAARAAPAGGASCPLPLMILDRWQDLDGDGVYEPGDGESYTPCDGSGSCTGYQLDGHGDLIEIKTQPSNGNGGGGNGNGNGNGNGGSNDGGDGGGAGSGADQTCVPNASSGWFCWIRPENGNGSVETMRDIIGGCETHRLEVEVDGPVFAATGNMQSVLDSLAGYIDENDSGHEWDATQECVIDEFGHCTEDSKRIRAVPLIDPTTVDGNGFGSNGTTANMAAVFMEKVAASADQDHRGGPSGQWNFYGRLLEDAAPSATGIGSNEGTLLRRIVLVE